VSSHSDIQTNTETRIRSSTAERLRTAFQNSIELDGTLAERLSAYAVASREIFPAYGDAVDKLVSRIEENGAARSAPAPGQSMPPFVLPDESGRLVDLEALLANGPTAIMFHRGHWCPYCRISINALARVHKDISRRGGQIVAISPDRQQYAAVMKERAQVPYPILTDIDNGYALSLNLAIWVGEEMQKVMAGQNLPAFQGNDAWMIPIPATFVVGQDGKVKERFLDPDYRRRMAVDDLVKALFD